MYNPKLNFNKLILLKKKKILIKNYKLFENNL